LMMRESNEDELDDDPARTGNEEQRVDDIT
jgi:hypothetical protein